MLKWIFFFKKNGSNQKHLHTEKHVWWTYRLHGKFSCKPTIIHFLILELLYMVKFSEKYLQKKHNFYTIRKYIFKQKHVYAPIKGRQCCTFLQFMKIHNLWSKWKRGTRNSLNWILKRTLFKYILSIQ